MLVSHQADPFLPDQLPGARPLPLPNSTRKSPLYPDSTGTLPDLPPGTKAGDWVKDLRTGRTWLRVRGETLVRDLDEAIVWILAHEAFHFLRRTRQVPGRNTEIEADRFADQQLLFYRTGT